MPATDTAGEPRERRADPSVARDREPPGRGAARSRPTRPSRPRPTRRPTSTTRPSATSRRSGRSARASGSTGRAVRDDARVGPAVRQVVHRRQAQRHRELRRPARRERPRRQGRLPLDRRAGRHPDDHLRRPPARGQQGRQRAQGARRRDRRPGRDLHADDPGAADRDARLRPDRGAAHGRLRRLLGRGAGGPDQRLPRPRSSSPPTAAGGAARRSASSSTPTRRCRSTPDDRARAIVVKPARPATSTWSPGRDVWWHDIVDRQSEDCPPVPVDSEHMLYLLYTSGTTAKPKGIMHTTAGYLLGTSYTHEIDLRHQARRRLLVRRRHRLGDRPQLHRLRPAGQRDDRASCTRARPTRPTGTAGGRSSRTTRSRSCTAPRPRSGRS